MSMQSHISELERRHAALEREIETAQLHPSVDTLEVAEMKRRKLRLKDEIQKLRGGETMH
ncbi:YdcH family protein [Pannonibacter sp.]|uniref:YdcH family protein n=1 Tax=Pannonibacter sp. TaxID=1906786 RepID=UPI0039263FD1